MFNDRILSSSDASTYNMPSLEEEGAPKTRADAEKEIEDIQRKAYEEGFAAGEKAGYADGEQKAAILIERLEKIIDEVIQFKNNLAVKTESQLVDLAVAIARKIIIEEVETRPEVIVSMVKESLKKLQRVGTITIRINPALYDLFMKEKSELVNIHEDIIFDVNSKIPVTGPLVVSGSEEVVTDVEALVENVVEELNNVKVRERLKGHNETVQREQITEDSARGEDERLK